MTRTQIQAQSQLQPQPPARPRTQNTSNGVRGARTRRAAAGIVAVLGCTGLLGTVAACGGQSVSDKIGDKVSEKIAEHAAPDGTDVDIDTSGDDAFMQVHNDDGTSLSVGGGDIPDGFPSNLPLPSDYTVGMAMSDSDGEITLTLTTPESVDSMASAVNGVVDGGDYELDGHNTTTMGGVSQETFTLVDATNTVIIGITALGDDTSVTYNVGPSDD